MKLATLKNQTRDGALLVVSSDLQTAIRPNEIDANLPQTAQALMDQWGDYEPALRQLSE